MSFTCSKDDLSSSLTFDLVLSHSQNKPEPERKRMVDMLTLQDWNYSKTHKELTKQGIKISIASLKISQGVCRSDREPASRNKVKMLEEKMEDYIGLI